MLRYQTRVCGGTTCFFSCKWGIWGFRLGLQFGLLDFSSLCRGRLHGRFDERPHVVFDSSENAPRESFAAFAANWSYANLLKWPSDSPGCIPNILSLGFVPECPFAMLLRFGTTVSSIRLFLPFPWRSSISSPDSSFLFFSLHARCTCVAFSTLATDLGMLSDEIACFDDWFEDGAWSEPLQIRRRISRMNLSVSDYAKRAYFWARCSSRTECFALLWGILRCEKSVVTSLPQKRHMTCGGGDSNVFQTAMYIKPRASEK